MREEKHDKPQSSINFTNSQVNTHAISDIRSDEHVYQRSDKLKSLTPESQNRAAEVLSHWTEHGTSYGHWHGSQVAPKGPFHPAMNQLLSCAFGKQLDNITISNNESEKNKKIGAKAHTVGRHISLGSEISDHSAEGDSLEVIAHEVAHALGHDGRNEARETLLDEHGDPGEEVAYSEGRRLREYVDQGMHGPLPRLRPAEGGRAAIHRFKLPIHGGLLNQSVVDSKIKYTPEDLESYQMGVSWNDTLNHESESACEFDILPGLTCKGRHPHQYGDEAKSRKKPFGPGDPLVPRSHYGDLQFIHGMASTLNESPQKTKNKILNYADCMFKIARKEKGYNGDAKLSSIPEFASIVGNDENLKNMSLNQFYGNTDGKHDISKIATGSLLHMVQDSFAGGHVDRDEQGRIVEFHEYSKQDAKKHDKSDSYTSDGTPEEKIRNLPGGPQAVNEGKKILLMLDDPKTSLTDFHTMLNKETFALSPQARNASPGKDYSQKRHADPLVASNLKPHSANRQLPSG